MTTKNYLRASAAALAVCFAAQAPAAGLPAIGELKMHRAERGETLLEIARKYDVGYVEMIAANPGVDPWVPGVGRELVMPTHHLLPDAKQEGIVVNVAEMRLYYFRTPGAVPETYPLGIGAEGDETPHGQTTVVRKKAGPTWYRTKNEIAAKPWAPKIVPPGPDNPLGAYALYLGWPTYLIHGTDDWRGVGRRDSRGCVRMYPEDIEKLFGEVKIGTKVVVVNQPLKLAWVGDQLYMQAHPTPAQADQLEMDNLADFEDPVGIAKTILAAAGPSANRLNWAAVRQAAKDRNGIPVIITR